MMISCSEECALSDIDGVLSNSMQILRSRCLDIAEVLALHRTITMLYATNSGVLPALNCMHYDKLIC
jgi:hypothetical protein